MKKSRLTESQIVSILKQADAGVPVKTCVGKPVPVRRRTTSGSRNAAAWKRRT